MSALSPTAQLVEECRPAFLQECVETDCGPSKRCQAASLQSVHLVEGPDEPFHERLWNQLDPIMLTQQRSQEIGIRLDQLCRNLEDMAKDEVLRGVLAQYSRTETMLRFIQQV